MISVIIVEDQPDVAGALHMAVTSEGDIEVAAICHTLGASSDVVERYRPDVVLTDFRLADGDAADSFSSWRAVAPATRVLVLSAWSDDRSVQRARDAGASGYLEKGPDIDALCSAIRVVASGGQCWLGVDHHEAGADGADGDVDPVTAEVGRWILAGSSTDEIAASLGLSERTVRLHVNALLRRHGARTRAELRSTLRGIDG